MTFDEIFSYVINTLIYEPIQLLRDKPMQHADSIEVLKDAANSIIGLILVVASCVAIYQIHKVLYEKDKVNDAELFSDPWAPAIHWVYRWLILTPLAYLLCTNGSTLLVANIAALCGKAESFDLYGATIVCASVSAVILVMALFVAIRTRGYSFPHIMSKL